MQDWVLDREAVHVDETGWWARGEGGALWTATTPEATSCRSPSTATREPFNALIGTEYAGIGVSDRWNGYDHLDPGQRHVCWSHRQRDFRRHVDGLGGQKTFGEQGLELTGRVFAAWRSYQHEHHDHDRLKADIAWVQTELRQLFQEAGSKRKRTRWHRQFANNLLKVWLALWTFTTIDGVEPTNNPADRALRAPPSTAKSRLAAKASMVSGSPTARFGSRDLPLTRPLAVYLSHRPDHRPQPRRSFPRARVRPSD